MKRFLLLGVLLVGVIGAGFVLRSRAGQAPTEPAVPDTGSTQPAAAISATSTPSVIIKPTQVLQGDPAEIVLNNVKLLYIASLTLSGKPLAVFDDNGRAAAITGIDLKASTGSYPIVATLADGTVLRAKLVVGKRAIPEAPLGIPQSLGGNTPQAAQNLVTNLGKDNAVLNSIPSASQKLWSGPFVYPVSNPEVTDTYGYTRDTVNTTISHKGLDFRAPPGTPVYAMNDGRVALAQSFTSYGNTVVIDHGLGVETMYMHLSEIDVKTGDAVKKGELIGKSGETGYAEGPHLHISVKIGGISIDPAKFLELFGS